MAAASQNVDPTENKVGTVTGEPAVTPDEGAASAISKEAERVAGEDQAQHWARPLIKNDDLFNDPFVQNTKSVEDMAEQATNAQKLIGQDKVPIPNEEWSQSQWNDWDSRMGVPEDVKGYMPSDFEAPEGWENSLGAKLLEKARALHVPGKMGQELARAFDEAVLGEHSSLEEKQKAHAEEVLQGLREEWGAAFDKKVDLANRAIEAAVGKENIDSFRQMKLEDGTFLGDNPIFARAFARWGELLHSEGGHVGDKNASNRFSMTPDEAKDEYERLNKHPARFNADDPEHGAVVRRLDQLAQYRFPEPEGSSTG